MRAAGTQIVCASGLTDVVVAAAAAEAGLLPQARRRVLLVCDDAPVPEAAPPWDEVPGFARLRARFDAVLSWNEAIRPFHPAAWTPRTEDVPLLERHFRKLWGLGDGRVELVLGAPDTAPAQSVARVFTGAPLHVYAAGPAGYGPTRGKLDPLIGTRVRQVLHLDLVPGLTPLLLGEFGAPARAIPADAFRAVAKEVASAVTGVPDGAALVVGERPSDRAGAEDAPHAELVRAAARRGHDRVVFAPHPASPSRHAAGLRAEAGRLGVDLTVLETPVPVEALYEASRPALVVGCASAALFTASALYGLPVARVGTERLLGRLTPYHHPRRTALVLAEAVLPGAAGGPPAAGDLDGLLNALAFTTRPQVRPALRADAERYLAAGAWDARWFPRRRLTALGLPGGVPRQLAFLPRSRAARQVVRRVRALRKAVGR
ncbi:alpha-2,8-polysialyltransferase family protein [Streptomyces pseudogriseolus]|uniref:alpha-2,8-polysialyltransferase family protein n=1 Tax=Streptomyces pseudogriseolus TaxID=36817 RepID=UPI001CE2955B|nr:alpha-2,8-polysialyltransferase family protein [Streptomyces pseudogriseolus]